VINAVPPAAVVGRMATLHRTCDVVNGALAQALPENIPAAYYGMSTTTMLSGVGERGDMSWVLFEIAVGGIDFHLMTARIGYAQQTILGQRHGKERARHDEAGNVALLALLANALYEFSRTVVTEQNPLPSVGNKHVVVAHRKSGQVSLRTRRLPRRFALTCATVNFDVISQADENLIASGGDTLRFVGQFDF